MYAAVISPTCVSLMPNARCTAGSAGEMPCAPNTVAAAAAAASVKVARRGLMD
jgi:hypothetical protein